MSSIVQTFQKRSQTLPVSSSSSHQPDLHDDQPQGGVLRRRLSSMLYSGATAEAPAAASRWALRRSQSVSAIGEQAGVSLRKWWEWGWGWVLSRKPGFAQDLEMNDEETKALGSHTRGTWRHVVFKLRSEIRRIVRSPDRVGLPQTCRYNSRDYAKNFDDGARARLIS